MLAEAPVEIRAFAQGAFLHPVFDFKRPFRALFLYPKTKDEVVIMAKLTDKQKKKIIAEHIEGATIRALAKKYKVSTTTVQRVLKSDADFTQKVTEKKEDNAKQVRLLRMKLLSMPAIHRGLILSTTKSAAFYCPVSVEICSWQVSAAK